MRPIVCIMALMGSAVVASGAQPARLGLLVSAPEQMTGAAFREFQRETLRLISLQGVEITWQRLEENDGTQSYDRLAVVRLRGNCQAGTQVGRDQDAPLGITHVAAGRVIPFVEIDCERVATTLARKAADSAYFLTDRALGLALGRVAAHEIYHVLAASMEHGHDGITKAYLSANELAGDEAVISGESRERIRRGILRHPEAQGLDVKRGTR